MPFWVPLTQVLSPSCSQAAGWGIVLYESQRGREDLLSNTLKWLMAGSNSWQILGLRVSVPHWPQVSLSSLSHGPLASQLTKGQLACLRARE